MSRLSTLNQKAEEAERPATICYILSYDSNNPSCSHCHVANTTECAQAFPKYYYIRPLLAIAEVSL